jgi:hypothetical protein
MPISRIGGPLWSRGWRGSWGRSRSGIWRGSWGRSGCNGLPAIIIAIIIATTWNNRQQRQRQPYLQYSSHGLTSLSATNVNSSRDNTPPLCKISITHFPATASASVSMPCVAPVGIDRGATRKFRGVSGRVGQFQGASASKSSVHRDAVQRACNTCQTR